MREVYNVVDSTRTWRFVYARLSLSRQSNEDSPGIPWSRSIEWILGREGLSSTPGGGNLMSRTVSIARICGARIVERSRKRRVSRAEWAAETSHSYSSSPLIRETTKESFSSSDSVSEAAESSHSREAATACGTGNLDQQTRSQRGLEAVSTRSCRAHYRNEHGHGPRWFRRS